MNMGTIVSPWCYDRLRSDKRLRRRNRRNHPAQGKPRLLHSIRRSDRNAGLSAIPGHRDVIRSGVVFGLLLASFAWTRSKSACSIRAGTGIWMTVEGSYLRPSRELRTPYGHWPIA
jgi:hypothetical protein